MVSMYLYYKYCLHGRIGISYIITGLLIGISGTLLSTFIRLELYSSDARIFISDIINLYNVSITFHGLIMIF